MAGQTGSWKQKLFWTSASGVAGMMIAGVGVYYLTRSRPALTYSVSEGPAIRVQDQYKRIFVYSVVNTGDVELKSVKATLRVDDGDIERAASEGDLGLRLDEQTTPNGYDVTANLLNQGERFSLSVMTAAPHPELTPKFAARGPGVRAVLERSSREGRAVEWLIMVAIGLLAGGSSAFGVWAARRLNDLYARQSSFLSRSRPEQVPLARFTFTELAADRWMDAVNLSHRDPKPKRFFCEGVVERGDSVRHFSHWGKFFEAITGWPASTEGQADLQLWTREDATDVVTSDLSLHFQFGGKQALVELAPAGNTPPERGRAIVEWAAERLGKVSNVHRVGCDVELDGTDSATAGDLSSAGVEGRDTEGLAQQLEYRLKKHESEWRRAQKPPNDGSTAQGKKVAEAAEAWLGPFESQLDGSQGEQGAALVHLREAKKRLADLKGAGNYPRGTPEYDRFWKKGDEAIVSLKSAAYQFK